MFREIRLLRLVNNKVEVEIKRSKLFVYLESSVLFKVLAKSIFLLFLASYNSTANAAKPEFVLEIKEHLFYPAEIVIPANKKVKLIIYNQDDTPEEFDSFDLNREKVIFPNKKTTIFIGPLTAGHYQFFGEFNPTTARGTVIVKQQADVNKQSGIDNVTENKPVENNKRVH